MTNDKKVIELIFENIHDYIEDFLGNDVSEEEYHMYLVKKYGRFFKELTLEDESDEMINKIVDRCVEVEGYLFESYDVNYKLQTILDTDEAFEYLTLSYWKGTHEAFKCRQTGVYLHGEEQYRLRLQQVTQCMREIKPRNYESAMKILLYAILDINFIFKNSDLYSMEVYDKNCLSTLKII